MQNVKGYKDIFDFSLLKLSDEGRFLAFKRNSESFTDVTDKILNQPILSIGLKSQYLYQENGEFKASTIKQMFTTEEKLKYKALGGKNKRYRMVYIPSSKMVYVFTYTNGVAESFYTASVGISDAFKIVGIEKRPTIHAKSAKMGVKFYAPILEKVSDVSLDAEDTEKVAILKSYFEPFKTVVEKATTTTTNDVEVPF
jgi:hypothetical protein